MPAYSLNGISPRFPEPDKFWVAPSADVIGDVSIGNQVSIWFRAVLRGDNESIEVGECSNIQDGAVLHTDPGYPLKIGAGCTIGHQAILHGCAIGVDTLIGMGATILNGARIGANSLVGARALITEGKSFPDGSLIVGAPAKVTRSLDAATIESIRASCRNYVTRWHRYVAELKRLPDGS